MTVEGREPRRTEVDGVPVWWAEAPEPWTISLSFRVGMGDERLPSLGLTHLVEHLALFRIGKRDHPYNGFVDVDRCVFYATGRREELLTFARDVAAALVDLPLERLEAERRVLRVEGAGGRGGLEGRLMAYRYGGRGPGLGTYEEMGLRWLGPDAVRDWSAYAFTRANAAVWMTCEPPEELGLGVLPEGARLTAQEPPAMTAGFPVHVADGTGGVALSTVAPRSTALSALTGIAGERLYDRIRLDAGLAYAPSSDYRPIFGSRAHVFLGSDCDDRDAPRVLGELWDTARALAADGPREEELERARTMIRRVMEDPDSMRQDLDRAVYDELLGYEHAPVSVWLPELDALDPATAATAMQDALDRAVLLGPVGCPPPPGDFAEFRPDDDGDVEGREFLPPASGVLRRRPARRLRVGDTGVRFTTDDGEGVTLRWDQLVMAEEGIEGSITLLGADESWMRVTPRGWDGGAEAVRALRERVPPGCLIPGGPTATFTRLRDLVHARGLEADADVAGEVRDLLAVVHDDEEVLELARATRAAQKVGLLAVTSRRVFWMYDGDPAEFVELAVGDVAVKRLALAGIELRTDAEELSLEVSREHARAIAEAVEAARAGV